LERTVAPVDLLIHRPLDIADDEQAGAVGQPAGIRRTVRQTRQLARITAADRQQPDLRSASRVEMNASVLPSGDQRG